MLRARNLVLVAGAVAPYFACADDAAAAAAVADAVEDLKVDAGAVEEKKENDVSVVEEATSTEAASTEAAAEDSKESSSESKESSEEVSEETLQGKGEVIVGTSANFEKLVNDNPNGVLIEFYAPWCQHCKKLEPEYEKAAKMLAEQNITIPLVKVDATEKENEKLATQQQIQGFPTLKWFVGGSASEYDGPRDADGIVQWVKTMTGPAVEEGEPKEDAKLSVTFYGSEFSSTFEEVAKANRKKAAWHFVKSSEEGAEEKMVVRHQGEEAIESKPSNKTEMEQAFKDASYPLFGALDGESYMHYMERENGLVWTLLPMTAENVTEVVTAEKEKMTNIAKKLGSEFSVTWTNTAEFGKVLEQMFGITEFPKIVVNLKVGDKKSFIYDGEMTEEAIYEYIQKAKSGEVKPHLKSEEVPSEESQKDAPVKTIVGKTIESDVFTADKDVLFEVYAPWCGHCKKLEPEYNKLGRKVAKDGFEDILTIAKMDGTTNDSPVDSLEWTGFPTIFYVKAGTSEPIKYDGPRDAKGMWKWIKANHSKADEIKAKVDAKLAEKKAAKEAEEAAAAKKASEEEKTTEEKTSEEKKEEAEEEKKVDAEL